MYVVHVRDSLYLRPEYNFPDTIDEVWAVALWGASGFQGVFNII